MISVNTETMEGGESFHTEQLSLVHYRVCNILFNGVTSYGDIVEVDSGNVVAVVTRNPKPTFSLGVDLELYQESEKFTSQVDLDSVLEDFRSVTVKVINDLSASVEDILIEGWSPSTLGMVCSESTAHEVAARIADTGTELDAKVRALLDIDKAVPWLFLDLVCSPESPLGHIGLDLRFAGMDVDDDFAWEPETDPRANAWLESNDLVAGVSFFDVLNRARVISRTHASIQEALECGQVDEVMLTSLISLELERGYALSEWVY